AQPSHGVEERQHDELLAGWYEEQGRDIRAEAARDGLLDGVRVGAGALDLLHPRVVSGRTQPASVGLGEGEAALLTGYPEDDRADPGMIHTDVVAHHRRWPVCGELRADGADRMVGPDSGQPHRQHRVG